MEILSLANHYQIRYSKIDILPSQINKLINFFILIEFNYFEANV